MPRISPTPLRLAKRTLFGSVIATIAYCGIFLPFPRPLTGHGFPAMLFSERLELVVVALPMFFGFTLSCWSVQVLSRGINRLRFTEERLDEGRRFAYQAWLTGVQCAVLLLAVVLASVQLFSHRHNNSFLILFCMQPLLYLRTALPRRRIASARGPHIEWTKVEPLHSDHWGDPPTLETGTR